MKLLIWSDSVCAKTGFARVAQTICGALPDWDITQVGINHPGKLVEHPHVRVYPTSSDDVIGTALARQLYLEQDFDLFLVIQDLHVTTQVVDAFADARRLRKLQGRPECRVVYHFPVDGPMLSDVAFVEFADRNICCTRWGADIVRAHTESKIEVLPHAVNTDEFYPLPEGERLRLRAQLFGIAPTDNTLAIIGVGANIGRKDFFTSLRALRAINEESIQAKMYLHTRPNNSGLDLWCQARHLGLSSLEYQVADVNRLGCIDAVLNQYYNVADVLLSTARREGFGIPIIEAMAAGTVVLGPNYGPFAELLCEGKYGLLHQTLGLTHWARGDNRGPGWQSNAETVALHLKHIKEGLIAAPEAFTERKYAARKHVMENYSEPVVQGRWRAVCHGS